MTVKEIVEKFLKENGYNGLFCGDRACQCRVGLVGEFMFCESPQDYCEPGYLQKDGSIWPEKPGESGKEKP